MKRLVKIFSIIAMLFVALTFPGCSSQSVDYVEKEIETDNYPLLIETVDEGYTFVGLYQQNEQEGILYLPGSFVPKGTYEVIVVENSKVTDGAYSYPNMYVDGYTFAGWYKTADYENGTRVASTTTTVENNILYARYITLGEAGFVAIVCIIIVFGMLALLWGIVALFKFIAPKEETKVAAPQAAPQVVVAHQKAFTIEDIKDEDMMAAALVATIDYHNQTGENVRVVSVKQIG